MNKIGYLIRFRPYTLEENCKDEIYHNHFNPIDEFYLNETDFNARVTELENGYLIIQIIFQIIIIVNQKKLSLVKNIG